MMKNIEMTCIDCGTKFIFSDGEIKFYKEKGLVWPKRCKLCREKKESDNEFRKMGLKVSSFLKNARLYGMPIPVEGGVQIEHTYAIRISKGTLVKYVKYIIDEKKYKIVNTLDETISYPWSNNLEKFKEHISKKFKGYKVDLYPIPHTFHYSDFK